MGGMRAKGVRNRCVGVDGPWGGGATRASSYILNGGGGRSGGWYVSQEPRVCVRDVYITKGKGQCAFT